MNRPFHLYALTFLCISLMGCIEFDDGADGREACVDWVNAANACLENAGMDSDRLDAANCEDITVGYGVTEVGISSCGFKDLAGIYMCYSEAYENALQDGLCDASDTVRSIDLDQCQHACDP